MSKFYKLSDPNEELCLLVEYIVSSIDRLAPLEKPKSQKQSWVTNSTKKILIHRNRLFSKWIQNPTELNKLKFSQARNLATKVIRNEKKINYYDKNLEMVEIRKRCSRFLMKFAKETPKRRVFWLLMFMMNFLPQLARN